jgi:phosphate-selective porin OprO/OprP
MPRCHAGPGSKKRFRGDGGVLNGSIRSNREIPMRRRCKLILSGAALALPLVAAPAMAQDHSFLSDWPTHHVFADGTDLGVAGLYQYDADDFSHDDGLLDDAHTDRRKYFGVYLKRKDVYDAKAEFDFQSKKW